MAQNKIWRTTKTVLKISVTAVALYWVFNKVEPKDLKEALVHSNPIFLVLAFIAYACSIVIASSRLNSFFGNTGLDLSERYNFKLYLLGSFYNLFLPGGVGGDGYKIYFLRRKFKVQGRQLLSAVFFDRLSGFWALCLIISALIIFMPHLRIPREIPILAVAVGTAAYYLVLRRYFAVYSRHFMVTHLKALGVQSMQVICAIFLLYALGFEGKFAPYLFMFLLSSLVAVVPFTVGGLGAREMVYIYGAQYFYIHLDDHLAVLFSLLFYLTSAAVAALGAYFIFRPQGLGEDRLPTTEEAEMGTTAYEEEEASNPKN
ncbi:lysylphosphatidylglycerol synthase transmembrane domain-containing protein [Parapedobacter sp. DT-150]|uniref:lysylphosphatidylglycerol synthase transmembrane domain-containing protein n=1 Tax=Parapedobacter sp. DT-150 TaxID=3396162 RepID=UPI003F199D7D